MTGRTEQGNTSRLSKQILYGLHASIAGHLHPMVQPSDPTAAPPKVYADAKAVHKAYQALKEELFKTFQKTGLGCWVKKPVECDQFVLAA